MSAADLSNFKSALRTKMNDSLLKRINDVEGMDISKPNSSHTQIRVQPLAGTLASYKNAQVKYPKKLNL